MNKTFLSVAGFITIFSTLYASHEKKELPGYILKQAYLHIPETIAQCETLGCIEKALQQEEYNALDNYLTKCNLSVNERFSLHSTWENLAKLLPSALFNTKQRQDTELLGSERIQKTCKYLEESGVNSDGVEIIMDDEHCQETDNPAYSYLSYYDNSRPPRIVYHNGTVTDHTIAHEVTHLAELHGPKSEFIYRAVGEKNIDKKSYHKWMRAQEMQAELIPLLRFKDKELIDQVIEKHMPQCIQDHTNGILPYKWNDSINLGFPDCSEVLPYIAKIKEINQ